MTAMYIIIIVVNMQTIACYYYKVFTSVPEQLIG